MLNEHTGELEAQPASSSLSWASVFTAVQRLIKWVTVAHRTLPGGRMFVNLAGGVKRHTVSEVIG